MQAELDYMLSNRVTKQPVNPATVALSALLQRLRPRRCRDVQQATGRLSLAS